jgi:hypothetical protein
VVAFWKPFVCPSSGIYGLGGFLYCTTLLVSISGLLLKFQYKYPAQNTFTVLSSDRGRPIFCFGPGPPVFSLYLGSANKMHMFINPITKCPPKGEASEDSLRTSRSSEGTLAVSRLLGNLHGWLYFSLVCQASDPNIVPSNSL